MGRLMGKVAWITGAERGQGFEEARLFAQEGACVVMTDIIDGITQAAEQLRETTGEVFAFRQDVTSEVEWRCGAEEIIQRYGRIDILVNNAGVTSRTGIVATTNEEWQRVMDVNAKSVWLGMKSVIPHMQAAGGGAIVNVSSIYALVGSGASAAYQASKAAVHLLTKTAAVEYARSNIRVNSVHPGIIETPMIADMDEQRYQILTEGTPMGRLGQAVEVASGVLFLASDEASYITGAELAIDGGYTAR